jgi:hypothetical protein
LKELLNTDQRPSSRDNETKYVSHPMSMVLCVIASINLIAGLILSAMSLQLFGACKYSLHICTSRSDFDPTPLSEIMSYSWLIGLSTFVTLGTFAVIIGLLNRIAFNTSNK